MIPRVLAIAGSDSGGGAGIQADIKTITMLGGHATTAVTAITAQNTLGVAQVMAVPADMVLAQIEAVLGDIGADAVKIGMIGSAETAEILARALAHSRLAAVEQTSPLPACGERVGRGGRAVASRISPPVRRRPFDSPLSPTLSPEGERALAVVVDPVMVASSGAVLADEVTIASLTRLMRVATLVTPNAPELAVLTDMPVENEAQLAAAARALAERYDVAVLAKGGHLPGEDVTDLLVLPDGAITRWCGARIDTRHSHGTGCTLSSAIATGLAAALPLEDAIGRAREYVRAALEAAPGLGAGHGPMGHGLGVAHFRQRRSSARALPVRSAAPI